jgi:N-acetylglucosaminyl-diphospho-decaprenol L-rhamnosyltransferase
MKKNLTIIILTYNSAHLIKGCLSKLNLTKYKVIVVDNASKDDTTSIVEKEFPEAQIIKLAQNCGYGRGNNTALRIVETEFSLILNPDSSMDEKDIDLVTDAMSRNPKIASAGPVILKTKQPTKEIKEEVTSTTFLSGSVLFLRTNTIKEIGLFDENIFMFYEDDELSKRVVENHYLAVIVNHAIALHHEGNSSIKTLFNLYRRNWHLKGWSKLYWKQLNKGILRAKISAARLTTTYFIATILKIITLNRVGILSNFGACAGSFSFLIGLKAFKKNGNPRP